MKNAISVEVKQWVVLIFLSIIWGTSFILIKKALVAFEPEHVAILRIGISGVAFLPFFLMHYKHIGRLVWWKLLVIGLTGTAIPAFLFSTAQTHISSSIAGILNSLTPIFTLLIGVFIFGFLSNAKQIIGVLLGFVGAFMLVYFNAGDAINGQLFYSALVVLAAVCYGLNINFIKVFFQKERPIVFTSLSFVLTGIPIMCIVPFTSIPTIVMTDENGPMALLYVTILALMSTVLALVIFYKLVQDTNPLFASTVSYLIPIVAMIWGFFDGETIGWYHFVGFALIMTGVYAIKERKGAKTDPTP